jgi:hypothetical protein
MTSFCERYMVYSTSHHYYGGGGGGGGSDYRTSFYF